MNFKDVLLISLVSTVTVIGTLATYRYIYAKKQEMETKETNLEDCAEMNQENDSTIFQEKPIQIMKPAEKKKIFDRFKPMARTVVAKKLLDEVLENRDILITIHLEKGDK